MRRILFPIMLSAIIIFGCGHKNAGTINDDPQLEYATVHGVNISTFKPQQIFLDTLATDFVIITQNNEAMIDTSQLHRLMNSAIEANKARIILLGQIKEADTAIKLRDISLSYAKQFDDAYNKEFKETLDILASAKPDKIGLIKAEAYPVIHNITDLGNTVDDADKAMVSKYNITLNGPDSTIQNR